MCWLAHAPRLGKECTFRPRRRSAACSSPWVLYQWLSRTMGWWAAIAEFMKAQSCASALFWQQARSSPAQHRSLIWFANRSINALPNLPWKFQPERWLFLVQEWYAANAEWLGACHCMHL